MAENDSAIKARPKRARARSGCIRCRAKRRKCDEVKPICGRCRDKKDDCQWGARIVFREENNHGLSTLQSRPKNNKSKRPTSCRFEIQDVTAEVIRDQQQHDLVESSASTIDPESTVNSRLSQMIQIATRPFENEVHAREMTAAIDVMSIPSEGCPEIDEDYQQAADTSITDPTLALPPVDDLSYIWPSSTALGLYDDSIFLPGSAYLDAYSTLRSHLIREVNTNNATRIGTPESLRDDKIDTALSSDAALEDRAAEPSVMTEEEEFTLLQNWVEEGQSPEGIVAALADSDSRALDGQV